MAQHELPDAAPNGRIASDCRPSWRRRVWAIVGYALVTLAFSWPLPAHLGTSLTGPPTGDTGVYVWNLWVFQHELLDNGRFPFFTSTIFSLGPRVDLALHNYTPFDGVIGLLLVPAIGVVGAFNLIYLSWMVLTAYAMYALARDVAGDGAEAWLGGLLLAFSPALIARGTAHFSLVAAAPLPLFALLLRVAERSHRPVHMVALGGTLALATYCDPYYGVYCLVLGVGHMAARSLTVERGPSARTSAAWPRHVVNAWVGISAAVTVVIATTGGTTLEIAGRQVGLTSLYTPVLSLTVAVLTRYILVRRVSLNWRPQGEFWTLVRLAPYGVAASVVLLSPLLVTLALKVIDGRYVSPEVFWRTSTPGVDLLAHVLPNPNHPLVRSWAVGWLASQPGGFVENVASIPLAALAVIAAAGLARRVRQSRYWFGLALVAGMCSLGPFVRVAGVNLNVPTPWALARYVPIVEQARAPARFTVLVALAVAVLFALALRTLGQRYPAWRRPMLAGVGVVLLLELLPAPRPLYSAVMPSVYDTIAADTRDVRVLELPFGVRDGLSSWGNFNASAQFHQTRHGKRLIGGYLSRVSPKRVESVRRFPVLNALILLSQGEALPPDLEEAAQRRAGRFVREARVGYVVVAHRRAPRALVDFAVRTLDLELVGQTDTRTLYRPRQSASRTWLAGIADIQSDR